MQRATHHLISEQNQKAPRKLTYFLSTRAGAISGMIKDNLREISGGQLDVAINFVDLFNSRKVLSNFKA